ncbi:MAG: hypothetical protein AAGE90_19860 [Pseudomonadota bacterium]
MGHPFLEALRPARGPDQPCFEIHLVDASACGLDRPRLAWTKGDFGAKRVVHGWSSGTLTTLYLRSHDGLAVIDWGRSRAIIWLPSMDAIPAYEHAAPLRWLFDLIAGRRGLTTLHAACVGTPGCGLLIAGVSGSGKSTLALSAAGAGLRYVGDDYCLLDLSDPIRAHSLYTTGKWLPDGRIKPSLTAGDAPVESALIDDKAVVFLDRHMPDRMVSNLPLKAVVIPELAQIPRPELTPAASHLAFRALAPSTIAQSEAEMAPIAAAVATLSRALPAYRLRMPPDPDACAEALADLAARLEDPAETMA